MFVDYRNSILSYISSIRGYFGLTSSYDENKKFSKLIKTNNPKKIFLILIDGMGANLIKQKLDQDNFLNANLKYITSTVFPSTTTAATTAILNGKAPNENAWLGWVQHVKELNDDLIPFYGSGYYSKIDYGKDYFDKYLPVKKIDEELNEKGIKACQLNPSFVKDGFENFDSMVNCMIKISNQEDYQFVYAYWDKYDSYMHEHGPSSKICNAYLEYLSYQLERLSENIDDDTMMVVIADHGQVDIKKTYNLYDSKYKDYFRLKPSIEPRAQTFFIKDGLNLEFEKAFKEEFEDEFILLSHQDVIDTKLFGEKENHQKFEEFIGDYLAIAKAGTVFTYQKVFNFKMKGQHAGCTDDELLIPIIVCQNNLKNSAD